MTFTHYFACLIFFIKKQVYFNTHSHKVTVIERRYLKLFFTLAANFHFSLKKICYALPASLHLVHILPIDSNVRTILNFSLKTKQSKGSFTIEAAIVLPFYFFVYITFLSFFQILGFQSAIQMRLEETSREINSIAYATTISDNVFLPQLFQSNFWTSELRFLCENSNIRGGTSGISFRYTNFDTENQSVDIVINYTIDIPFIPGNLISFPFAQHCSFKLFTGNRVEDRTDKNDPIVYITANGTVYHTNKYCTYLCKYADVIDLSSLPEYEKKKNRSYQLCNTCRKIYGSLEDTLIYISNTGESYHYSRDCYYLTSHIFEYRLSDVSQQYNLCSRCNQK